MKNTPLWLAVGCQRKEMVKLLLRHHADASDRNTSQPFGDGRTPVMIAVHGPEHEKRPDPEILQLLIDHGADVDAIDGAGRSALVIAVGGNSLACVRRLLDAGASLEVHNGDWSLRNLAQWRGFTQIGEMLEEELRNRGEKLSMICHSTFPDQYI